jgi:hypothetical protein
MPRRSGARKSFGIGRYVSNEILAGWPKLHPVGTVSDVKLNKALESELEEMFIERLRRAVTHSFLTVRQQEGRLANSSRSPCEPPLRTYSLELSTGLTPLRIRGRS